MQYRSSEIQSGLLFESPSEIYARIFQELKPRTAVPPIQVCFRRFANANSFIRLAQGGIEVRITDLLEGAPAPIGEALAYILLGKLLRREIAGKYAHRYRLYLNRRDMRGKMQLIRQIRGRKFMSGPIGKYHNLDDLFETLNREYFSGLMGRPLLGWSRRLSRTMLGHFDPSHNAIIISRIFDDERIPKVALEYVMFHEMLHLCHPVEHAGSRRCVHTKQFKEAEQKYPHLREAKEILKRNL